jgi:hypothetical protein
VPPRRVSRPPSCVGQRLASGSPLRACGQLILSARAGPSFVYEVLLLLALVHVLAAIVQGAAARLWTGAALLAAAAVLMKYSAALLATGLLLGLLVSPARGATRTRWRSSARPWRRPCCPTCSGRPPAISPSSSSSAMASCARTPLLARGLPGEHPPRAGPGHLPALDRRPGLAPRRTGGSPLQVPGDRDRPLLVLLLATRRKGYYFAAALPPLAAAGEVAHEGAARARVAVRAGLAGSRSEAGASPRQG